MAQKTCKIKTDNYKLFIFNMDFWTEMRGTYLKGYAYIQQKHNFHFPAEPDSLPSFLIFTV
jgi:hypothetical protein